MKHIWDISPQISPDGLLFPGDEPYRIQWTSKFSQENPINLCAIRLSPHVGAHADAPLHYAKDAASISELDILPFIGTCKVIHAIGCNPLIKVKHLQYVHAPIPERIIIRTRMHAATVWESDYTAIEPETIVWLHSQGVKLIGIDTPSVDPFDCTTMPCHKTLHRFNMRVLENLVLDDVPENDYELIALPLKLAGACASPVRAILRSL